MTKPENPQAFPAITDEKNVLQWGMTLRDYFAAAALQGILSFEGCNDALLGNMVSECFAHDDAKRAYAYADAMLKARQS